MEMRYSDYLKEHLNKQLEAHGLMDTPKINPHAIDEKFNKEGILEHMKEKLADRGKDYGKVIDNHQRQCDMVNPYLSMISGSEINISPSQMATMMLLIKIGRLVENKNHLDSVADLIGYAACMYEMVSEGDNDEKRKK